MHRCVGRRVARVLLCAKCCVEGGGYRMGGGLPTAASVGPGAEEETRCRSPDSAASTINSAVDSQGRWKLLWTVKDEEFGQLSGG